MSTTTQTKNPYQQAWDYQTELANIELVIKDLTAEKARIEALYEKALIEGEATGRDNIDGYHLVTETRVSEKRTVRLDDIKHINPDILLTAGTFDAGYICQYLEPEQAARMLADAEFDQHYKLGLGELERAVGGKKQMSPYIDTELTPKITKRVARISK